MATARINGTDINFLDTGGGEHAAEAAPDDHDLGR
jgi:hypothetical protein